MEMVFPKLMDFICLHHTLRANAGFTLSALNNLYVANAMPAILNGNSHESILLTLSTCVRSIRKSPEEPSRMGFYGHSGYMTAVSLK